MVHDDLWADHVRLSFSTAIKMEIELEGTVASMNNLYGDSDVIPALSLFA